MQAVSENQASRSFSQSISESVSPAVQRSPDEESAVGDMIDRYMQLWSSHKIAEHSKLLAEDAVLVNVVGMRVEGRSAIQQHHEQLHRTIFARSQSRALDIKIKLVDRNVALVHMHWEMHGAAKLPGWNVPDPRTGWMTLVWVKRDGVWRVSSLHNTDTIAVSDLPTE